MSRPQTNPYTAICDHDLFDFMSPPVCVCMVNDSGKMSNRPKTIICVAPAVPDREGGRFDIAARALPLLRDLVPRPTLFAQLRRMPHQLKARPRPPRRQAAPRRTPL